MRLFELNEQNKVTKVVFAFGRLNPPHYGHGGVIRTLESVAKQQGAHWYLFVSSKHDSDKNPLTYEQKCYWIKTLFPEVQGHLVEDSSIKTPLVAATWLYKQGYRSATFVAGEDDMEQYAAMIRSGNEHGIKNPDAVKMGKGFVFNPLDFAKSQRLASATNARAAVASNDREAFARSILGGKITNPVLLKSVETKMFDMVRKGMNLNESAEPKKKLLDKPTPTVGDLAEKYHCSLLMVQQQLDKGIEVEMEHTSDKAVAREIALDHLKEKLDYYKRLEKVEENFADGKGPGRPGDSQRHGIPKGATIAQLEKHARRPGRAGQLARWQLNMRRGKKRATEDVIDQAPVLDALHEAAFRELLLQNPELYENEENYKDFKDFISGYRSEIPKLGNDYVYASVSTVPVAKIISIAYFVRQQKLIDITDKSLTFSFNGVKKTFPFVTDATNMLLKKAILFKNLAALEEFKTMLVMRFSNWRISFKKIDSEQEDGFAFGGGPGGNADAGALVDRQVGVYPWDMETPKKSSTVIESLEETLKKVKGKWALVSRHNPKKVLQYYHGSQHPSKNWVSKVERRVHSFESQNKILPINQDDEGGNLEGYVVDTTQEQIPNYLSSQGASPNLINSIINTYKRVGLIRNMWVDEEARGQGTGSGLLEAAIDQAFAYGAEAIILVADMSEDNNALGKSLDKWYEGWGFKKIGMAGNDPVMILKNQNENIMEDEEHIKPRVYLDMDGVLADFFGEWSRISGVNHYKDIDDVPAKLELIRQHPTFWVDLPILSHAKDLIKTVIANYGEYRICSKPLEGDDRSKSGKMAWIQQHLSDMPPAEIILTADKSAYATHDGVPSILVDDYGVNVNAWRAAGGIGIKYDPVAYPQVAKILASIAKSGVPK
jgi:5'(3')-deoxyribonucleotidase